MLSYLHGFHAGNHADILKHVTLMYVLEYLSKKDKPWCIFDTHAGSGMYSLSSPESLKTGEAARGISKLLEKHKSAPDSVPEGLKPYIDFVNSSLEKNYYPGSPAIEIHLASRGKGNAVFLSELHKKEYEKLLDAERCLSSREGASVSVVNKSGWEVLKSRIPPAIKRGAVLCDPSYEDLSDYHNAAELLSMVHRKWSGGTVMLWYPLLSNKIEEIENMKQQIFAAAKNRDCHTEVLDAVLCVDTEDSHVETTLEKSIGSEKPRLYGSGMLVVNPSWGLEEHLKHVLPFLASLLGNDGNGSWSAGLLDKM